MGLLGGSEAAAQLDVAGDHGEQVVEVVRDSARELSHRFHLLRLPQLLLDRPLVRHVHCDARSAKGGALGIERESADGTDAPYRPVWPHRSVLDSRIQAGARCPLDPLKRRVTIVGVDAGGE